MWGSVTPLQFEIVNDAAYDPDLDRMEVVSLADARGNRGRDAAFFEWERTAVDEHVR